MSQEKAQLIAPIGIMTVPGLTATGVITATSFSGNVVGSAKSLVSGSNVTTGLITATSFVGNLTGNILRLADSGPDVNVGATTATSFSGNLTGSVTDLTSQPAITVGVVTATGFEGPVTGNIRGNITGNVSGIATGSVTGNVAGVATGSVTGNVTGLAGSVTSGVNLGVGVCTALEYYGDGSALTGAGSSASIAQVVVASGSETIIDLSDGNLIFLDHNANTTIGFASTSPGEQITIIKTIDVAPSPTLAWPDSVGWNDNTTPTPIGSGQTTAFQVFHLTTGDTGTTYQGWTEMSYDPPGNLFTNGQNNFGQLGQNDLDLESSPAQVGYAANWSSVWGGESYGMIATKDDGSLWGWGRSSSYGNLGLNDGINRSSPTQIGGTGDWTGATFAGGGTVLAVKSNGTAWAWGTGGYGGTGQNDTVQRSSPTQIGTDTTWSNTNGKIGGTMISMFAIKTNGTLWSWGNNEYGELGQGNLNDYSSPKQIGTNTTWASVTGGPLFSAAAVKTNGTLWTWGRNNNSQLGQNNQTQYNSPKQVGTDTTWARVNSGTYHTMMAVKTDGTMWMWGRGGGGVSGQNNQTPYSSPRQIPGTTWDSGYGKFDTTYLSTAAIKTDGTLWGWGANEFGELGTGNRQQYSSPIQIGTGKNWNSVALFRHGATYTTSIS